MSSGSPSGPPPARRLPAWLLLGGAAAWRIVAIVAVAWLALQLLGRVRLLAISFLIAVVVTALLAPLARLLRNRVPRALSALLPLILAVGVIGAVATLFARGLMAQWDALVRSARSGWERIQSWIEDSPVAGDLSGITDRFGTEEAMRTVTTTLEIGSGILLVLVFTFFLLRDGERIAATMLRVFHGERREQATRAAGEAWHTLERYIVGIAAVSAINTALTAVALLVLDIPMVLPLVLFTFIACFVPFIGTIVATAAGALVALSERGLEVALIFVAAGIAIEILESNVTQPLVQGRALHVHPLLVVAVVTAGTVAFGIPGAFLAVPALAVAYGIAKSLAADHAQPDDARDRPEAQDDHGPPGTPAPA